MAKKEKAEKELSEKEQTDVGKAELLLAMMKTTEQSQNPLLPKNDTNALKN